MNINDTDDLRDIALKLDKIRKNSPEDYFYIKGWIHHSILQKERDTTATITFRDKDIH